MHFKSAVMELILALLAVIFTLWELPNGWSSWIVLIASILIVVHAVDHMRKSSGSQVKVRRRGR